MPGDGKPDGTFHQNWPGPGCCQRAIAGHVRDLKVWRHEGRWYMVLERAGSAKARQRCCCSARQTSISGRGGEFAGAGLQLDLDDAGYMWSVRICFRSATSIFLDLLPGDLARKSAILNTYRRYGWPVISITPRRFHATASCARELDAEFEFYALQTMRQPTVAVGCWSAG